MKDPACLFFISDWLTSTSEMDADCRGWYLNLMLHNYDKKDLPNDVEKLAVLANVKFSEYERFKQVFEQVLKQKFEQTENNRLTNLRTQTILKNREIFSDKRSEAGKLSYLMRYMSKNYAVEYKNNSLRYYIKNNIDTNIDIKNKQVLKQVFEHLFKLYRNENENIYISNKEELNKDTTTVSKEEGSSLKGGMGGKLAQGGIAFGIAGNFDDQSKDVIVPLSKIIEINFSDTEIYKSVCEYFNLSEIRNMNEIFLLHRFLVMRNNKGDLPEFEKQFPAYVEYKKRTNQIKHSFSKFIGDLHEDDGGWKLRDWKFELENMQPKNGVQSKIQKQDFFTNNPYYNELS